MYHKVNTNVLYVLLTIHYTQERAVLKKIMDAIAFRRNFKKTYEELSKLSTRELQDIGIHRNMITRIAAEQARGEIR